MLNAQKRKLFVLSRFLNCIRLVRLGGGAFLSDVFFRAEHLKMQFYAGNKRKQMVLDDASFTVEQGEAVGIVGPSGAGKSTIARIICGLIRPEYGDIYFKGTHIVGAEKTFQKEFRTQIQLIPQQPYLSLDPKQKVGSSIMEPLFVHKLVKQKKQAQTCAYQLLHSVRLERDIFTRYPGQISGGQAQRVVIARALAVSPELIIADESTSMLDVSAQAQVIQIYKRLIKEQNVSFIFISHNLPLVKAFCSKVYGLQNGMLSLMKGT